MWEPGLPRNFAIEKGNAVELLLVGILVSTKLTRMGQVDVGA